eukprot:3924462-Rhodomonas_salina.3
MSKWPRGTSALLFSLPASVCGPAQPSQRTAHLSCIALSVRVWAAGVRVGGCGMRVRCVGPCKGEDNWRLPRR